MIFKIIITVAGLTPIRLLFTRIFKKKRYKFAQHRRY